MTRNITLAIEEDVLEKARIIAARRKTTVNGLVREFLERTVGEEDRIAESRRKLLELADTSEARLGPDYQWSREETYADRMFPRHERGDLRGGGKE